MHRLILCFQWLSVWPQYRFFEVLPVSHVQTFRTEATGFPNAIFWCMLLFSFLEGYRVLSTMWITLRQVLLILFFILKRRVRQSFPCKCKGIHLCHGLDGEESLTKSTKHLVRITVVNLTYTVGIHAVCLGVENTFGGITMADRPTKIESEKKKKDGRDLPHTCNEIRSPVPRKSKAWSKAGMKTCNCCFSSYFTSSQNQIE